MSLDQLPIEYIDDEIDLTDASDVIDLFEEVSQFRDISPCREGSLVTLGSSGQILYAGDLHDHRGNFRRILKLAALDDNPENHLILQNVIHPVPAPDGRDTSILTLAHIAALQMKYRDRVHLLLSNHELGQVNGETIYRGKDYVSVLFDEGLEYIYGDDSEDVRDAMKEFVGSLPLAVTTKSGIFCCHSLPNSEEFGDFNWRILHRDLIESDRRIGGNAYNMVWGKEHDGNVILTLRRDWRARLFVVGNAPTPKGTHIVTDSLLRVSSWHKYGVAIPIDLFKDYDAEKLAGEAIPLESVEL